MLLNKDSSCLLLIDIQEKLTPLVQNAQALVARCQWLQNLSLALDVPICVTEQYPEGLGPTVSSLNAQSPFVKTTFSCLQTQEFTQKLQKKQYVLAGIEAHVCVLQTAMDMHSAGYEVFVVADAVSSRTILDYEYGLARMRQNGIQIVSSEMVLFEWLRDAKHPQFKAISQAFLK